MTFGKILRAVIGGISFILLSGGAKASSLEETIKLDKVYITSCVNDDPCTTDNKEVVLGNRVKLNAVVEARVDGRKTYFSESRDLKIAGKKIDPKLIRRWDNGEINLTWYKVESEKSNYSNWSTGYFKFEKISYIETLIKSENGWTINPDARPTDQSRDVNDGLGTMRYKLEVKYDGKSKSTSGKEAVSDVGIEDKVYRLSFRRDGTFIGWLTGFCNNPYIYGSFSNGSITTSQPENYIGADCADLVVWAYNKTGHKIKYTNVAGLFDVINFVAKQEEITLVDGIYYKDNKPLIYGKDIKDGDLITFGKIHVGVVAGDNSPNCNKPNGLFDQSDLMFHILFDFPSFEPIGKYGGFSILRFKK